MALMYAGFVLLLLGLGAALVIVVRAFKESVSQGFLCLCMPFYVLYYAFARFEHPRRALVIVVLIAGFGGGLALTEIGAARAVLALSQELGGRRAPASAPSLDTRSLPR